MEEHFNENYMESSKFPKSTFKGKVLNFDKSKLTTSKTAYELEGDLTIHGVTKKVKTKIYLSKDANKINAKSDFSVKLSDYNIEIPSLVKDKISKAFGNNTVSSTSNNLFMFCIANSVLCFAEIKFLFSMFCLTILNICLIMS